jgi:hypothetical protein
MCVCATRVCTLSASNYGSACMRVRVYEYACVYIYIYCIYIYTQICACVCVYACMRMRVCVYMYINCMYIYANMRMRVRVRVYACMRHARAHFFSTQKTRTNPASLSYFIISIIIIYFINTHAVFIDER